MNAFALISSDQLLFSRRLLDALDDAEIDAVCAHELGHLGEPERVKLTRVIGSFSMVPLLFLRPARHEWGFAGLAAVFLCVYFLRRLAMTTTRQMEHRADDIALSAETGSGVYARALQKIYEGNSLPAVMPGSRLSHPDLYDRMIAAGVTPDFPRPLPPARRHWLVWVHFAVLMLMVAWATQAHIDRKTAEWEEWESQHAPAWQDEAEVE